MAHRQIGRGGPKGGRPVIEESRGMVNANHRGGSKGGRVVVEESQEESERRHVVPSCEVSKHCIPVPCRGVACYTRNSR
ncbi:MAG: hypothetical protein ACTTKF_08840, partial [Bacteroides sp.]